MINKENFGIIEYDEPTQYIKNLKNYIEVTRPFAINLLQKYNIYDSYIIPEEEFNRDLTRTLGIRDQLKKVKGINIHENNSTLKSPLNQIFYGPPGTGKTYHTINNALEIIGIEDVKSLDRSDLKVIFETKVKEGQIVFTTFHQSMSYEDFIEGIKPNKPSKEDQFLKYDIQPGVFL